MTKNTNLVGNTYGRLTVLKFSHKSKAGTIYWSCKCSCGNASVVRTQNLVKEITRSCGCYQREIASNAAIDETGNKYGRLIVVKKSDRRSGNRCIYWICECECGNKYEVRSDALRGGITRSCGCLISDSTRQRMTVHGHSARGQITSTYRSWQGSIGRCTNPNNPAWEYYGGRGIKVCNSWRESFENFLADMGECPEGYSIDRIDNDGNYEPGNCRWASKTQQSRNSRFTRLSEDVVKEIRKAREAGGITYKQLAERYGVKSPTTIGAIFRGKTWIEEDN